MLVRMWRKDVGETVRPTMETVRWSLKELKRALPYDPVIPLLGIYL